VSAPKVRASDQELYDLYVVQHLSQEAIATKFGVHQGTVSMWLTRVVPDPNMPPKEDLRRMYEDEHLSTWEIATRYDVSQTKIRRWLRSAQIPPRDYKKNKMPTPKGGSHSWGLAIRQGQLKGGKVGRGRVGDRGPLASNWKGGTKTDPQTGRVHLWSTERARYFPRAWFVWQESHPNEEIGQGYVIHHIDSDPTNDTPENLVKLSAAQHVALHRKQEREHIVYLEGLLREAGIDFRPMHEHTD
jgi:transposase